MSDYMIMPSRLSVIYCVLTSESRSTVIWSLVVRVWTLSEGKEALCELVSCWSSHRRGR